MIESQLTMPILETISMTITGKSLTYLATAIGLATAGSVDSVNLAFNQHSMLAETGLPFEAQLGLAALFLTGFVVVANKFLTSQEEKFKILSEIITKQDVKIKDLENELKALNSETRNRLNNELDDRR